VRVLVGPAAAAQMEPVAVGSVPFAVTTQTEPFVVHGEGPITYDQVLEKDWGTYAVTLNLDSMVDGECVQGTRLDAILEMSGHQNVKVDAGEFQAEYPWEGGHTLPLDLPLEEGATTQAEGWEIVLHLNGQ
jgi:hypothetical protein